MNENIPFDSEHYDLNDEALDRVRGNRLCPCCPSKFDELGDEALDRTQGSKFCTPCN